MGLEPGPGNRPPVREPQRIRPVGHPQEPGSAPPSPRRLVPWVRAGNGCPPLAGKKQEEQEEGGGYAWSMTASPPGPEAARAFLAWIAALAARDLDRLPQLAEALQAAGAPAAWLREAILLCCPYLGFPLALAARERVAPFLDEQDFSEPETLPPQRAFEEVYGAQSETLLDKIRDWDPKLSEWTLSFAYGSVLGRCGLPPKLRELAGVAILSILDLETQMFSHARGAIRCGATKSEVLELVQELQEDSWIRWGDRHRAFLEKNLGE
ncbi:MAG TPA: hypothetical protein ENK02_11450 [Planctomycetes bacterium]|nr:hypothetical protein [Planctomycetota bacterium]